MPAPLRWGILGATSRIYHGALKPVLDASPLHEVVAEASRAVGGDGAYADLVERADVDAVYIPLPNHLHVPWIERAVAAGKHVLCEKPIGLTLSETERAFGAAAAADRHLIEAYMWPHHERSRRACALVADGAIGTPRFLRATFTYQLGDPGDHRADERGGGVLLDVGIYCIGPALLLADREPVAVQARAVRNAVGVDTTVSGFVDWGEGFVSSYEVSFDAPFRTALDITGTAGLMTFPAPYFPSGGDESTSIVVTDVDGVDHTHQLTDTNGYRGMVDQFAQVVRGEAEPLFAPAHSLRLARILDASLRSTLA